MPYFPDLSGYGYFLFDEGGNGGLYVYLNIQTFLSNKTINKITYQGSVI